MTCVIFVLYAKIGDFQLKNTFSRITTAIILSLILTGPLLTWIVPTNSVAATTETNPDNVDLQLIVTGLVQNPLNLSWIEIFAMPKTTVNAALICVDFPNQVLMEGNFTGIKLRTLIETAKPSVNAIKVAFFAADGYSTDLTVETARRDDIIIAYEKDGNPLINPVLVVPGKWGYKWISQPTHIELVDYNFLGKWESAGYSDEADIGPGGAPTLRDLSSSLTFPSPNPNDSPTTSPSPSPNELPETSASPNESPETLTPSQTLPSESTPKPETSQDLALTSETILAVAAIFIVVTLLVLLTFTRQRNKQSQGKPEAKIPSSFLKHILQSN
jgi:hypothetical protein